jgi:GTP-binding protein
MNLDFRQLVLADIPGLIEGASAGAGMGVDFLRHIARTRSLAFVVDVTEEHPEHSIAMLRHELGEFEPSLLEKPWLIAANKADLDTEGAAQDALQEALPDVEIVRVSALTGIGIRDLAGALFTMGEKS